MSLDDATRSTRLLRHYRWVIVLAALLAHTPGYFIQLFDPDEASIAAQAITLRNGGQLYLDAIDRKPPIPALIYELVFRATASVDLRPLHLLGAAALAVAALAVASDVALRTNAQRLTAGLLLVASAVAFLPTNAQATNYAHLAMAPGAVALVCARRRAVGAHWLAGVCLALAVMTRQTWAIGILPGCASIVHNRRWRIGIPAFGLGMVAGFAPFVLLLDGGGLVRWVFISNDGFLTSPPNLLGAAQSFIGNGAQLGLLHLGLFALLAVAGWQWRSVLRKQWDLGLWVLTGVIAWLAGLRFFGHYAIQLLPAAALLATIAAATLRQRTRRSLLVLQGALGAAAVGLAFFPGSVRTLPSPGALSTWIDKHVPADRSVMVWGNYPEIYWSSDRSIGGALVTSDLVTGLSAGRDPGPATLRFAAPQAGPAMMSALARQPPAVLIHTSPANWRQYGHYPLSTFPTLNAFVQRNYVEAARIDGFVVYRRR